VSHRGRADTVQLLRERREAQGFSRRSMITSAVGRPFYIGDEDDRLAGRPSFAGAMSAHSRVGRRRGDAGRMARRRARRVVTSVASRALARTGAGPASRGIPPTVAAANAAAGPSSRVMFAGPAGAGPALIAPMAAAAWARSTGGAATSVVRRAAEDFTFRILPTSFRRGRRSVPRKSPGCRSDF
jgi:hypothetical protein